jgi:L-rhamnose mutarotase
MSVEPRHQTEYVRRDNPIWAELEQALLQHGVQTYSIFLDAETGDLFAYAEVESEDGWRAIASTDVCRRWWRHMRAVMPSNADDSPVSHRYQSANNWPSGFNGFALIEDIEPLMIGNYYNWNFIPRPIGIGKAPSLTRGRATDSTSG